jgi:dihydrofolate reductase
MGKVVAGITISVDGFITGPGDGPGCGLGAGGERLHSAREFAGIWQAAEKIVFSTTLASVPGARTRIEPTFDPAVVRRLKSAAEHDMTVGSADLAGQAIKPGLVDELQLFLVPVVVGGGKRALPDGVRSDLELLDTRRFASGAVYLRYRPKSA